MISTLPTALVKMESHQSIKILKLPIIKKLKRAKLIKMVKLDSETPKISGIDLLFLVLKMSHYII